MLTTARDELCPQSLPVVVRSPSCVCTPDPINDASIAIEQSTHKWKQELIRRFNASDRQTLARREAHRKKPVPEAAIGDLNYIDDVAGLSRYGGDPIVPTQKTYVGLNKLPVHRLEV